MGPCLENYFKATFHERGVTGVLPRCKMAKVLVLYYSRTGNTHKMAEAVAEGARQAQAEVDLREVKDCQPETLVDYDGIIVGSPTYYGILAGPLKDFFDQSIKVHGKLEGKVGGAFSSAGIVGGGCETAVLSIVQVLLVHGMVIRGFSKTGHYGPVAFGKPDERALKECKQLGETIAQLAQKLS